MMTVTHQERGRFMVESHGVDNLVDVLSNQGAGRCSCIHWSTRLQKDIEEAKREGSFDPKSPKFKCPHIEAADRVLLQLFKGQLMKQFPDNSLEGA
jgi:hypothetical protein